MDGGTSIFSSTPFSDISNPTSTPQPTTNNSLPRLIRRRFATTGRVRSGCLTCKKRKKKCDDQRWLSDEWCQSCVRLGLVCERLPLRTVTAQHKQKHNSARDRERAESASAYGSVREGNTVGGRERSSWDGTEDQRRSYGTNTDDADNADDTDDASPSSWPPSPPYQALTLSPSNGNGRDGDNPDFVKTPSNGFMALFALENASPERILLKYYVEHLAPLCSILQQGSNEFRNVLLPMAIDDSSLLYALFAYASFHVPSSGPVPSITPLMKLKFETQAARGLSEAIRLNSVSESSVACALICSTAEAVSGDTKRWLVHHNGAGHLLNQLGGPKHLKRTSDGQFLMRNFAYHDIIAALSTGSRPRFRGVYWLDDSGFVSADCLMGLAHDILGHMSDICYFMADVRDQEPSTADFSTNVLYQGERLALALRSQPLDRCSTLSDTEQESLVHHAEAFRFSALLHLYRFLSQYAADDSSYIIQINECLQNCMKHIHQVPSNLSCEVGLVFPLFMAGVACADDDAKILYIRTRLENIESWTKFQHITRILEVIESLWASGQTDWESLLRDWDWHVSLA